MPKAPAYNQQRARARNQTTVAQAKSRLPLPQASRNYEPAWAVANRQQRANVPNAPANPLQRMVRPFVGAWNTLANTAGNMDWSGAMSTSPGLVTPPPRQYAYMATGNPQYNIDYAQQNYMTHFGNQPSTQRVVGYSGGMPRNTAIPKEATGGVKRVARQWGSEIYPEGYTEAPATQQEGGYGDLGGYGDYGGLGRYADTNYPGYTGAENNYNRAPGYAAKMEENPYWRRALATWRF